ncbi:MAG: phage portal protein [Acidobacteriaceae bacterium]|nr:phage portal protein [Acidobacteriaceae bacterium]
MFKAIANQHPRDKDLPGRAHTLAVYKAVLDGTLYDVLPFMWHEERSGANEYIPISKRAPAVRYGLCRMAVEDSVSLLFGDNHFPGIQSDDQPTVDALNEIARETHLDLVMTEAATRGSVGSIAVLLRILKQRVFIDVYDTIYLTPSYDPEAPDTLVKVAEKYRVKGADLAAQGYTIAPDDMNADHWFCREWDALAETWFVPQLCTSETTPKIDDSRTVQHGLGFCPWVWVKNLPGGNGVDGACTFRAAIDTQIDIEYQLSLGSRALKYSAAPTLMIKEPSGTGKVEMAAGDTIIVDKDGDAKWLEIDGAASAAVIEYVRLLRETALESIHGNRSNADKVSAAQSGRALELLHQPLIWLADKLRLTYGECGLLPLYRMIVAASQKYPIKTNGKSIKLNPAAALTLSWPRWFPATAADRSSDANTLRTLTNSGLMSEETAIKQIAPVYDIASVQDEISAIAVDQQRADARAAAQAAAVTATEAVSSIA